MLTAEPPRSPQTYPGYGQAGLGLPAIDPERLAGVFRRYCATVVDGILLCLVAVPITGFAATVIWNKLEPTPSVLLVLGLFTVVTYVASLAYIAYWLIQIGRGSSPGKHLLGVRVISLETGEPAGFWQMMLREIVGKFVSQAIFGLGYLWAIWDEQHQGWHDKIAGTVVVRQDAAPVADDRVNVAEHPERW